MLGGTMAQLVRVLVYNAEGPGSKFAQSHKISCYNWLVTHVVCLGKVLYSHLPRWPERIREVSVMGKYYNLSADWARTWPVATLLKRNDCDDFPDTVKIGLRIKMSKVISNALYKYCLLLLSSLLSENACFHHCQLQIIQTIVCNACFILHFHTQMQSMSTTDN